HPTHRSCFCPPTLASALSPLSLHDALPILALALGLLEAAGEVATKVQVHDDAITGHDHLFDLASDIRDRRMHQRGGCQWSGEPLDRKSTRLNSSHGSISYAVFCLKKKKKRT